MVTQPQVARRRRRRSTDGGSTSGAPPPAAPSGLEAYGDETVVLVVREHVTCGECGKALLKGDLAHYEGEKALCLDCAVLRTLELLPSGDVALTRRATKRSKRHAVVVEWSPRRKRWERRGTLVEPGAIALAKAECAADAAAREQQRARAAVRREAEEREYLAAFTARVKTLFPGCPTSEAREIGAHACEKHSGRVGRTAAAKELEDEMVRLAVVAHVRHLHTSYDQIIARTRDKRGSRDRIRHDVAAVLRQWEQPPPKS
jgi:hypothetical protein